MSDNKLLAIFCITVISGLTIAGVVDMIFKKSEHDIRMEKIEEIRALSELTTTIERNQLLKDIDSMRVVIYKEREEANKK
jgi:hypothetical protein